MNCPITYEPITGEIRYSTKGLHLFAPTLADLRDIPYSAQEQRREAVERSAKMSIQGVQPKLSAVLNVNQERFDIVDSGGVYILKPQSALYPELPENEDLAMRLAAAAGIETPLHALIYARDSSLTYVVKRFDRASRGRKYALEDFAQLLGRNRDTKYDSSMEQVADVLERYCTFPMVEKMKLLKLTIVNFLIGNEDAHLKNFSLIARDGNYELSPAYDIVNSTIAMQKAAEEIALPLRGKKRGITRKMLLHYYALERLGLPPVVVQRVIGEITAAFPRWQELIGESFLSAPFKKKFSALVQVRRKTLAL